MEKPTEKAKGPKDNCDQAQAPPLYAEKVAALLVELSLKQAMKGTPHPQAIPEPLTLPGLTVMHKYFNSNALHLEIKGLIQVL